MGQSLSVCSVRTLYAGFSNTDYLKVWRSSNSLNNPEMSQNQRPKGFEVKIVYVLILFLLSSSSLPLLRTDRIKICPLTFSQNLQFFPEALVALTLFATFSRIWVSWYLNTWASCHLELDSPTILFLVPCNDLDLICWILSHIHKHMPCPSLYCWANFPFVFCCMSAFVYRDWWILHQNSCPCSAPWLVLLLEFAMQYSNNSAFPHSKLSEGDVLHLAEGIQC